MLKGIPIINLWQTCLLGVSFVNFHLFESLQIAEPTNNEAVVMGCCVGCSLAQCFKNLNVHNFRKTKFKTKSEHCKGKNLHFPRPQGAIL